MDAGVIMMAGRPTVITAEAVRVIVGSTTRGLSIREACRRAGISHEAYYSHIRNNGIFRGLLVGAENWALERARVAVVDAIANGDPTASRWYLERKCPVEFGF